LFKGFIRRFYRLIDESSKRKAMSKKNEKIRIKILWMTIEIIDPGNQSFKILILVLVFIIVIMALLKY